MVGEWRGETRNGSRCVHKHVTTVGGWVRPAGELWEMAVTSPQSYFTQGVKTLGHYPPTPIHHW